MKDISTKTKAISIILIIIIIAGIIVTFTTGLNFELKYQETKKIQVLVGKEFEISEIKEITDEVLPEQEVIIQKAREFEDVVNITTKEMTEEQKTNLVNKINEKYGQETTAEDIKIVTIPHTRGRDIVKPYILPFIVASAVILVYFLVKYRKLEKIKMILTYVIGLILPQLVLLSIIAITRIPIGRTTMSLVLIVYVLTLLTLTNNFETKLNNKRNKENKALE